MKFQIIDGLGRVVVERRLVVGGFLFLVSGSKATSIGSMNLVDIPRPGELVYATFKRKLFGVRCIPIQSFVTIELDRGARDEIHFTVGMQKYIASRVKKRLFRRSMIAISLFLTAVLFGVVLEFIDDDGPVLKFSKSDEGGGGIAMLDDEAELTTPFDLAKRYIRSGSEQQARMSLIEVVEVVEGGVGDERAVRILDGMGRGRGGDSFNGSDQRNLRAFFDGGVGMEMAGNYVGALKSFNSALNIIGDGVRPSYYEALITARNDVKGRVVEEYGEDTKRARKFMEVLVDRSPFQTIEELGEFRRRMRSIESIFPEAKLDVSVGGEVDSMIDSTAAAWMDGATSAEYLSGCSKAKDIYLKISHSLKSLRPKIAGLARDRASSCSRELLR